MQSFQYPYLWHPYAISHMYVLILFWIYLASDVYKIILSFNMMILFCMSALKYDPGTSKMATYLPLGASIMIMVNRDSKYMVGDDSSSLGIYNLCGLPYAHVLPFNFPNIFLLLYLLHVVPPFFVIFDAVRIQCYHHLHILYMCLILVHV